MSEETPTPPPAPEAPVETEVGAEAPPPVPEPPTEVKEETPVPGASEESSPADAAAAAATDEATPPEAPAPPSSATPEGSTGATATAEAAADAAETTETVVDAPEEPAKATPEPEPVPDHPPEPEPEPHPSTLEPPALPDAPRNPSPSPFRPSKTRSEPTSVRAALMEGYVLAPATDGSMNLIDAGPGVPKPDPNALVTIPPQGAEGFSRREFIGLLEQFYSFDEDKSGELNDGEIIKAMHGLGLTADKDEVETLMTQIDSNANGKVELTEFFALARLVRANQKSNVVIF